MTGPRAAEDRQTTPEAVGSGAEAKRQGMPKSDLLPTPGTHCDSCYHSRPERPGIERRETETNTWRRVQIHRTPISLPVSLVNGPGRALQRYFVGTRVLMLPGPLEGLVEVMSFGVWLVA